MNKMTLMASRYNSKCTGCKKKIAEGDQIWFSGGREVWNKEIGAMEKEKSTVLCQDCDLKMAEAMIAKLDDINTEHHLKRLALLEKKLNLKPFESSEELDAKLKELDAGLKEEKGLTATRALEWTVFDSDGEKHTFKNLHQFALKHGLSSSAMHRVCRGKQLEHKGWTSTGVAPRLWEFLNDKNEKVSTTNLAAYCREHNLQHNNMLQLIDGKQNQHLGHHRLDWVPGREGTIPSSWKDHRPVRPTPLQKAKQLSLPSIEPVPSAPEAIPGVEIQSPCPRLGMPSDALKRLTEAAVAMAKIKAEYELAELELKAAALEYSKQ